MNKLFAAVAVVTTLAFQVPANAYVVTVEGDKVLHNPFGDPEARFNKLTVTPYGDTSPDAGPFNSGHAHFFGEGLIINDPGLNALGKYAEPYFDKTNYLAILGGSHETIKYHHDMDRFGLYWGSIDDYNSIKFYDGKTLVAKITGADIIPVYLPGGLGAQQDFGANRYLEFTDLPWFNRVVLSSSSNSFEVDNISAGAPELSTWAMMLVGFAGIGFVAYRRTKKRSAAVTASV
jgi:hypothetical protein